MLCYGCGVKATDWMTTTVKSLIQLNIPKRGVVESCKRHHLQMLAKNQVHGRVLAFFSLKVKAVHLVVNASSTLQLSSAIRLLLGSLLPAGHFIHCAATLLGFLFVASAAVCRMQSFLLMPAQQCIVSHVRCCWTWTWTINNAAKGFMTAAAEISQAWQQM